jgi:hypothetical protein
MLSILYHPQRVERRMSGPWTSSIPSVMRSGSYRRLFGVLRVSGRTPMLETGDWLFHLETPDDLAGFDGALVIVEGRLAAAHRLSLTWIGRASADTA